MDKAILSRVGKQAWFHRFPRGLPVVLFALSAGVTLLGVTAIEHAESERRHVELDRSASEIASGIQRRASENVAYLRAAASLFEPHDKVTRAEFTRFATNLYGADDHGAVGIGWARRVGVAEIPALEAELSEPGAPFRVRRASHPDPRLATPIVYLEPRTPANVRALGFDMYSDPARREGMLRAARLAQPVATGAVQLVQDEGSGRAPGFLLYMPVYDRGVTGQGVKGFVYSPFRTEQLLRSASHIFGNPRVDIALYDEARRPDRLMARRVVAGENGRSIHRPILVGGRRWVLSVSEKRPASLSQLSILTLVFGGIVSVLLMTIARLVTRRAVEDRQVLEWLTRQSAIRTSLTRELNHRVKNTLANVLSIIALTRRRYEDVPAFADSLVGRVRALSATHDLLTQTEWSNAPIGDVVRSELSPYMIGEENHVELVGPEVGLAPNDALSLGLAIHELATNAAKYGALSTPEGRVRIEWRLISPELAEVSWRERAGPPVRAPERRGFGMDLLERIVSRELNSRVDLRFEQTGLECTLRVPVRAPSEFELRSRRPRAAAA